MTRKTCCDFLHQFDAQEPFISKLSKTIFTFLLLREKDD
ncbi:hypothetical protein EV690_1898 [Celerinatantimonas diazotrophica]|uniref:Uncharacterized protein n=1 Tax=Celerinatantimonas diazotrophica TaxID=412034 RepID=A0A4R1JLF2_9GAMM|nr:hypothetical protein EV690_1898 [Celerinatantimonas diazotrophica]CAG9296491.1 hypothetical protein CEDIAZO_01642 [Celerinatantimonas diazotrophica]